MLISKHFKIAQEGATTDGREITRQQIEQMAANYDRDKYGARIWIEHLRSLSPYGMFDAQGDVIAVEAREEDGKMGLYAQIEPTPHMVYMNRNKQKIYSSIEMDPDFSDTGEAYLVGLGVTDSPASLGTEVLAFSSQAEVSLFTERKQRPENVFAAAIDSPMEFTESDDEGEPEDKPTLLSRVKSVFSKHKDDSDQRFADSDAAILEIAESQQQTLDKFTALQTTYGELLENFTALQSASDELSNQFTALADKLEDEPNPNHHTRQPASGGSGELKTDC